MYTEKQIANLNHNYQGTNWSNFRLNPEDNSLLATHTGELHEYSSQGVATVYNGAVSCRVKVPAVYAQCRFKHGGDWQDEAAHDVEFSATPFD